MINKITIISDKMVNSNRRRGYVCKRGARQLTTHRRNGATFQIWRSKWNYPVRGNRVPSYRGRVRYNNAANSSPIRNGAMDLALDESER